MMIHLSSYYFFNYQGKIVCKLFIYSSESPLRLNTILAPDLVWRLSEMVPTTLVLRQFGASRPKGLQTIVPEDSLRTIPEKYPGLSNSLWTPS